jgi:hypothetical protein
MHCQSNPKRFGCQCKDRKNKLEKLWLTLSPKRSILTSPASSNPSLSYCTIPWSVMIASVATRPMSGVPVITIPPNECPGDEVAPRFADTSPAVVALARPHALPGLRGNWLRLTGCNKNGCVTPHTFQALSFTQKEGILGFITNLC